MTLTLKQDDQIRLKNIEPICRVIRERILSDGTQAWMVEYSARGLLNNRNVLTVTAENIAEIVTIAAIEMDASDDLAEDSGEEE